MHITVLNLQQISLDLQNEYTSISQLSKKLISHLYRQLNSSEYKASELYLHWSDEFKFIYGNINDNFSSNKKIKATDIAEYYDFNKCEIDDVDIISLFFSIQTYLSLFVRLISYKLVSSLKDDEPRIDEFKYSMTEILNGAYFRRNGISNYCYSDWYCWIENSWDERFESLLRTLIKELETYNNLKYMSDFLELHNNDYIKQIYETIIPKQLRHALGEYYTPDWLASFTIKKALEVSNLNLRQSSFLDPTCGSGTFLFKTIQLLRKEKKGIKTIIDSVIGFDINPLAVLTSKTNYLISIIDLIKANSTIEIPIYNYDVINSPKEHSEFISIDLNNNDLYCIPISLLKNDKYKKFINILSTSIEFNERNLYYKYVKEEIDVNNLDHAVALYDQLIRHDKFVSKIIINIILNRIAGYLVAKVDMIIGNPPWVNWEYLPQDYRIKSQRLWKDYGIFSVTGRDLSFSKEDISVLITYVVIDKFLIENGYLAFVIRQGLFKSAQNGVGFRKFKVDDKYGIKAVRVDDLSTIKPFENASNSTAIMFIQKNHDTVYPVPYYMWEKRKSSKSKALSTYSDLSEILTQIDILPMIAMPAIQDDISSMWITAKKEALDAVRSILGSNKYKARTGVFTGGANAVYWLNVTSSNPNGNVNVSNITERAKRKVDDIHCELEGDLVYPLVQGSDLQKWEVNTKSYILCPHTAATKMKPINEENMKQQVPLTYAYLLNFREDLDERKGFAGWEKEIQKENFYAILRVGDYTFSKYKVAWRYIATEFICAVISDCNDPHLGNKLLIPNEKVMYVSTNNESEAYYLCGVLSSNPVAFTVKSFMNPTSISAHVLEKLSIAEYDESNSNHKKISDLCKRGHHSISILDKAECLNQINHIISEIYNITKDEMLQIDLAIDKHAY